MMSSPDQFLSGKQYELRVIASDLELRKRLSALSLPEARGVLPGDLYLFSQQHFGPGEVTSDVHRDIDRPDITETQFKGFQMKVSNYTRQRFSLGASAESLDLPTRDEMTSIQLRLRLGAQAASAVMAAPFFAQVERESGLIAMRYNPPRPLAGEALDAAIGELADYTIGRQVGSVTGLRLVEAAFKKSQSIRGTAAQVQAASTRETIDP